MGAEMVSPLHHGQDRVTYEYTVWLTSGGDRIVTAEACEEENGHLVFRKAGEVRDRIPLDLVQRYTSVLSAPSESAD